REVVPGTHHLKKKVSPSRNKLRWPNMKALKKEEEMKFGFAKHFAKHLDATERVWENVKMHNTGETRTVVAPHWMGENSVSIVANKYLLPGESVKEMCLKIAETVAKAG